MKELVINEMGEIKVVEHKEHQVLNRNKVVAKFLGTPSAMVPLDGDSHLYLENGRYMVIRNVKKIKLRTGWDTIEDEKDPSKGVEVPRFEGGGSIDAMREWTPPKGMEIFIITSGNNRAMMENAFIVSVINGNLHKTPFPNIYPDNKLCTGEIPTPRNIYEAHVEFFEKWSTNRWNNDLNGNTVKQAYRALVKFDAETGEQINDYEGKLEALLPTATLAEYVPKAVTDFITGKTS